MATPSDSPQNRHKAPFQEWGGVLPGAEGKPAFELVHPVATSLPVLIAVPHAGRSYPDSLLERMRHPADTCLRLEDRLVDMLARDVAAGSGATLLVAHAPRAMIDLNRAPEDMDWDMVQGPGPRTDARHAAGRRARSGLGLVPRRLHGLGEIWRGQISRADLQARIDLIHRPYHLALSQRLEALRDKWGAALLVDLHSMPPLGAKTGREAAPDFVIGDRYGASCAAGISLSAADHFVQTGWRAAHNRPYAGGYVLDRHATPQRAIHAVQIEVCRAAYLDPALRQPGDGMEPVVTVLTSLVRRLADELLRGCAASFPQAAE
jgi:N-formylglutamate amidohydrolase